MQTKLTLRMEESLIKSAKRYSKIHGKSLSQLIADYLLLMTEAKHTNVRNEKIPPLTKSLKGILRHKELNEDDYKKYLENKYR